MFAQKFRAPSYENNGNEGSSLWATHRLALATMKFKFVVHRGRHRVTTPLKKPY